jgi:hypothetical protein
MFMHDYSLENDCSRLVGVANNLDHVCNLLH